MATVAGPTLPKAHNFFDLPLHKLRSRRREDDGGGKKRAESREEVAQRGEEVSRGRAKAYLNDFLQKSEWGNRMNQFTVVWDAVPTMEELESYGDLDETEGTRACRKLFKAVVVWDELGHCLWERLKTTSKQKRDALKGLGPMLRMGVVGDDKSDDIPPEATPRHRSRSRGSSKTETRNSSQHSSSKKLREKQSRKTLRLAEKPSYDLLSYSELGGHPQDVKVDESSHSDEKPKDPESRPGIPRLISHNCATAVRKTLGVFGDSRTSLHRHSR